MALPGQGEPVVGEGKKNKGHSKTLDDGPSCGREKANANYLRQKWEGFRRSRAAVCWPSVSCPLRPLQSERRPLLSPIGDLMQAMASRPFTENELYLKLFITNGGGW